MLSTVAEPRSAACIAADRLDVVRERVPRVGVRERLGRQGQVVVHPIQQTHPLEQAAAAMNALATAHTQGKLALQIA